MSRTHNRAARRERETAQAFKTKRVHRRRYESAPDVEAVTLASGAVLQPEIKTRKKIPALVRDALAQARRYRADAVPVAVISATGGEAIACLPLRDLVSLLGLQPLTLPVQPELAIGGRNA